MRSNLFGRCSALVLTLMFTLSACVTINIYFPAAAAEKAAETFIDDIWQLQDSSGQNASQ